MPRKLNTSSDHFHDPFPSVLRKLKDEHDTTQEQLAAVLGLAARQSVTGYTDGSTSPTPEKIVAVAKYYGVTADYLLGLSDNPSIDPDIQAACKTTGLSQRAIENIIKLKGMETEVVDEEILCALPIRPLEAFEKMVESSEIIELCVRFAALDASCARLQLCVENSFDSYDIAVSKEGIEISLYRLAKQAEALAEDMYKIAETKKKAEA